MPPDSASAGYLVELRNVTKRFAEVVAVDQVTLQIRDGEFFSLLGPSGCGKTTSLRLIAGFEMPDRGRNLDRRQAPGRRSLPFVVRSTPSSRTTPCFLT